MPEIRPKPLKFSTDKHKRYTHYLFRYPAKFHPPVVCKLLKEFTLQDQTVLDPFCGSGTLLVESMVAQRSAIGIDVDPLAAFVSRIKTRRVSINELRKSISKLTKTLSLLTRTHSEYELLKSQDISIVTYQQIALSEQLDIPEIPNLLHWFRRYVVIDLARIRHSIETLDVPKTHKDIFLLCFASIIRNVSNADPVPVSGLEVTSYMKKKEEDGRIINPFKLLNRAVKKATDDLKQFNTQLPKKQRQATIICADTTELCPRILPPVDAVITSPPYQNAVDYYRRHTLEMYWLRLVKHHEQRLELRPKYIGRSNIRLDHPYISTELTFSSLATTWESRLRKENKQRANAFKHYVVAIHKSFNQLSKILERGSPAIFVIGRSSWNGTRIPTDSLYEEISSGMFSIRDRFWYPVKNRYMSYSRQNGANINKEYVLVFEKL